MKKIKTRNWPNIPFTTWEYEPQTEMKHKVLKYYLGMWAKILGKSFEGLNYIDGFGGHGAYHTDTDIESKKYVTKNFGSPVFSMQAIASLKKSNTIKHANAIIIDENESNLEKETKRRIPKGRYPYLLKQDIQHEQIKN